MTKRPGKRTLSRKARAAMGAAGFRNLAEYKARVNLRARELEAAVTAYRDALLRDAGAIPSASRLGLIEGAVTTYAGLLKVRYALIHSRKSDVVTLTERVSWLTSNLSRLLRQLNLDTKPRPRTLADVFAAKPAPAVERQSSTAPIPAESEGKPA